jgi:sortase B
MEQKKKILNNIKSRKLQKITIVVSTAIVIAICTLRINYLIQLDQNEKVYEQLRTEYIEEPLGQGQQLNSAVKEPEASEEVQTTLDAPALQETNSDIYAWLTVDNTKINYPILQNEKDDYYLNIVLI